MKTRNTFILSGLFGLIGSFASGQEANPVQVHIQIYELDPATAENFESFVRDVEKSSSLSKPFTPDQRFGVAVRSVHQWENEGKARLFAKPVIAAPAGSWTTFEMIREITYPTKYDPASVPDKLPAEVIGASERTPKGEVTKVKTSPSGALVPPFPSAFEKRDLGIRLKIRPHILSGGRTAVEFQTEQSVLAGFINYGKPIAMKKPNALRKKAKPLELLENQILMPSFHSQKKTFKVSQETNGYFLLHQESPTKTDPASPPPAFVDLGKEHSEPHLPPLLFLVSSQKLDPGLKSLPTTDSGSAEAETRSWELSVTTRRSLGMKADQPGPPAAAELGERFSDLGIRTRELTIDPDWNLEAVATPEMIGRIDELLPVYNANPQILIATKFIETSKPLDLEKSILTESEFQNLVREFNQKKGVDLLSAPSVMVRPFQDGKIEVGKEFIYPVSYDPPAIAKPETETETGPSFPVTPSTPNAFKTRNTGVQLGIHTRLFEDKSIEVNFRPEVTEFLGFLNFGQPIYVLDQGALGKYLRVCISENAIQAPVFQSRSLESRVRIPDGGTIVVGGLVKTETQIVEDKVPLLGDLPIIGRAARSKKVITFPRYLYIAVTARTMEGAGLARSKK